MTVLQHRSHTLARWGWSDFYDSHAWHRSWKDSLSCSGAQCSSLSPRAPPLLRHAAVREPLDQPGVGEACFVWSKPESEIDLDLPSTASPISNASCGGAE